MVDTAEQQHEDSTSPEERLKEEAKELYGELGNMAEVIRRFHKRGHTISQIAAACGVSYQHARNTAHRYLKRGPRLPRT